MTYTEPQTLEQFCSKLGLEDARSIKIYFKPGKVTASCTHKGYSFGSKGRTLEESLNDLVERIHRFSHSQNATA